MILLEIVFKDEKNKLQPYIFDVLQQRFKHADEKDGWYAYKSLDGEAVKGKTLTLVWPEGKYDEASTVTWPVESHRFIT